MTAHVGDRLETAEQLDALPELAVVLADPDGQSKHEDSRRLALQKRTLGVIGPLWCPAWGADRVLDSYEAVTRFHLGPFIVLSIPASASTAAEPTTHEVCS